MWIRDRTITIYMAKLGQDGHDRGAKVISSAFSDFGINVEVGNLFQSPAEAVEEALKKNAHVIGVSSLAAGHKTLIPDLIKELKKRKADDILVFCGGVIPKKDYQFLYDAGVSEIFGPGSSVIDAAHKVIENTTDHLKRMHNYRKSRIV